MSNSVVRISRRGQRVRTCGILMLSFSVIAPVVGCSDHRMGLDEFLRMQERVAQAPGPAVEVPAGEPAETLLEQRLGPYRVGPGDVLAVWLTGADQTTSPPPLRVRVDRQGVVHLPLAGNVQVADRELPDVEAALFEAYVPAVLKDLAVHVELIDPAATNVLVLGAVTSPGLVPLRRTERDVFHAIVQAGGLVSDIASGQVRLRRLRQPAENVILDLTTPEGVRQALAQPPLEAGDVLTVQAVTPNTVFVGGLVNAPRPQVYPQGVRMSVLQALAAGLGLRTDVTPREATLIRRMPDGSDAHVKLNLDRITKGKDPNIMLAAGDILWVPHTTGTRIQDWVNRNIFFRAGVSATAGVNYNAQAIEFLNSDAERSAGASQGSMQDLYDPFGYLLRNNALQALNAQAAQPR
ncbi:MAG TPA: polysaccharide biosynthesis/export family protein [Phycisphaerae bacterium]|nr:polysaccharide biosynthesis/export family protein [Phycisphaerae bacterium]HNU44565.1 polysaccharide biosynthesis/export family protein [Phycisphaerae bacterium]